MTLNIFKLEKKISNCREEIQTLEYYLNHGRFVDVFTKMHMKNKIERLKKEIKKAYADIEFLISIGIGAK